MVGIAAAAYALPGAASTVGDWCTAHGAPEGRRAALEENGCARFHFAQDEGLISLGRDAIEALLRGANVAPDEVDALISCHTSPCNVLAAPHTLVGVLREECRLSRARALSIGQQQCVSGLHALRVLQGLFALHLRWRWAVIVNADIILAEQYRTIGVAGIHSDAGSALLLRRDGGSGLRGLVTYNDARANRGVRAGRLYEDDSNYGWTLVSVIRRVLKAGGVAPAGLASVLPHNVNLPAWRNALDALGIPQERLFTGNFGRVGHAFGSDVAINIADSGALRERGAHLVFTSGIGGCFGGFVLETGVCA